MFINRGYVFRLTTVVLLYVFCVGYVVVPRPLAAQNSSTENETGNENTTGESTFDPEAFDHGCIAYMLTRGPEAVAEADTVPDSLSVQPEPTEYVPTAELPKKQFIGTTRDVVIAVMFIAGWLVFMWIAANQKSD